MCNWKRLLIGGAFSIPFFAMGATPEINNTLPASAFSGETVCYDVNFQNTGSPGYGPYLRIFTDEGILLDSVTSLTESLSIESIGQFSSANGFSLDDHRAMETVSGSDGQTFALVTLPVGSVVENGPDLTASICVEIDSTAEIGTSLNVALAPVYEYGDTATGDNGPVSGSRVNAQITPGVFSYDYVNLAVESERAPGSQNTVTLQHTVDIADGQTLTSLSLNDLLSADLTFNGGVNISNAACSADTVPVEGAQGGQLNVTCGEVTGSAGNNDIRVTYDVFVGDILDETNCSAVVVTNAGEVNATFNGNGLPAANADTSFTAKHLAVQQSLSQSTVVPGDIITVTDTVQTTRFGTTTSLILEDSLPDGLRFVAHGSISGAYNGSITPSVVTSGDGTQTVSYNIHDESGDIAPGSYVTVSYTVEVQQNYAGSGSPVVASDALQTTSSIDYALQEGASACTDNSGAQTRVRAVSASKSILAKKAEYVPGDSLTFRLSLEVPSGDTTGIRFVDYFPLPVTDASSIDLNFGNDIRLASTDTANLTPTSITYDAGTNAIAIEWPSVTTPSTQTIAVDIGVTISDDPFADGLQLTNLFLASTENSVGEQNDLLRNVSMLVRAPDLSVALSDNALETVDAGDVITYSLAVTNNGGANAYDVTAHAPASDGLNNAIISAVTIDGLETTNYSGSLADGTFVVNDPLPPGSEMIITYTRDVAANVVPRQVITSTTATIWASNTGASAFPAQTDSTSMTVGSTAVDVVVSGVSPQGSPGDVVTGDTVSYLATVTLPEGEVPDLVLSLDLPAGFEYVAGSAAVNAGSFAGTVDTSPTISTSGNVSDGQNLQLAFDSPATTTTSGDNDASNNSFTVAFEALVKDSNANSGKSSKQTKTIGADVSYTNFSGGAVTASTSSSFAEHNVQISTSVSPSSGLSAGDTVTVTFRLRNRGTAPAYDVDIAHIVNSAFLDPATVIEGVTPSTFSYSYSAPSMSYTLNSGSVAAGAVETFTYTAKVRDDVQSGSTFSSSATVTGDSQDGAQAEERSQGDTHSRNASTLNPTVSEVVLLASSEAWTSETGTPEAAIGEVLTYAVIVNIPEGVTKDSATDNDLISVSLPAGHQYLAGTGLIRANFESGLSSSETGTLPLSDTAIVPTYNGNSLVLNLGDITNTDDDSNDETITFTFDVQAINTSNNNAGDAKSIAGYINFENAVGNDQSHTLNANSVIVAPDMALSFSATPATVHGGESVTYTITATNQNSLHAANAWEWAITESIPARLIFDGLQSATLSRGSTDVSACFAVSGQDIELDSLCLAPSERYLAPGESITVVYTADVDPSIGFEEQVTSTASVSMTSLPGEFGTADSVSGSPGEDLGERTGSQATNTSGEAVNLLNATAQSTVTADAPQVQLLTSAAEANIGDDFAYSVTFSVPTGTTDAFIYTLNLPAGVRYDGEAISIQLPESDFSVEHLPATTYAAGTAPVVLDFGALVNAAAFSQNVTVEIPVLMENVIANQAGEVRTAEAELTYAGVSSPVPSDTVAVTVKEPDLAVSQTIISGATGSDAGDTVRYRTSLSNVSTNSTAYQVAWRDIMPAELLGSPDGTGSGNAYSDLSLTILSGSAVLAGTSTPVSTGALQQSTTNQSGDTISLPALTVAPGTTLQIEYDLVLANSAQAGQTLQNTASLNYNSREDGTGRNGSDGGNDNDDSLLNNYNAATSSALEVANSLAIQTSLNEAQPASTVTIGETLIFDNRVDVVEGEIADVYLTIDLPAGVRFVSSNVSAQAQISYDGAGTGTVNGSNQVTVPLGTVNNTSDALDDNDYFIVTTTVVVEDEEDNVAGGSLVFSSQVEGAAVTAGPDTLSVDIVEPALNVTLEASTSSVTLGDTVTYTFTATPEAGSTDAYETVAVLSLSDDLTYLPDSFTGQGTPDSSVNGELTVDLGAITVVGGAKTFSFDMRVDNEAEVGAALLVQTRSGRYSSLAGEQSDERTYSFDVSSSVAPDDASFITADQQVTLTYDANGNGFADPGDEIQVSAQLVNTGDDATQVVFTHPIPTYTSYISGSLVTSQGTTDDTSGISVQIGTLAASESAEIRFDLLVEENTPAGTVLLLQGLVDSDNTVAEPTDADGIDENGDQANTLRTGGTSGSYQSLTSEQHFALVTDADSDNAVSGGDTMRLTYTFANNGTTELTELVLSELLPSGLSYVGGSASITAPHEIDVTGSEITATLDALAPGEAITLSFDVFIDAPLVDNNLSPEEEVFTLQGTLYSAQTGSQPLDANGIDIDGQQPLTFTAVSGVAGSPNVQVTEHWVLTYDADGDGMVDNGDEVTFTVNTLNTGSAQADDLFVNQTYPADTIYVNGSAITSQGALVSDSPLSVNLGDLAPGEEAIVSYTLRMAAASDESNIVIQSEVSGGNIPTIGSDNNSNGEDGNNPALINVTAAPQPAFSLSENVSATSDDSTSGTDVVQGETIDFVVTLTVPAGTYQQGQLQLTLPENMTVDARSTSLFKTFETGLNVGNNPGDINSANAGDAVSVAVTQSEQTVSLPLGGLINTDDDVNAESLTLALTLDTRAMVPESASDAFTVMPSFSYVNSQGSKVTEQGAGSSFTLMNRQPVPLADAYTINEDDAEASFNILANDSDADNGQVLVIDAIDTAGLSGTATIANGGANITYIPAPDFYGSETFSYTVKDGAQGLSVSSVTFDVTPLPDAPVAIADSLATAEDVPAEIIVTANDYDVDNEAVRVISATADSGAVTVRDDDSLVFSPAANMFGTATITYVLEDVTGRTDTGTVAVTIASVNDAPQVNDEIASVDEDQALTVDVLANDSDVDGDLLSVSQATATRGNVSILSDGRLQYVPTANFFGNDTITYQVSDGHGGMAVGVVDVTVNSVNDVPVTSLTTVDATEDTPKTISLLAFASDVDGDSLSVSNVSVSHGSVEMLSGGVVQFTPAENMNGNVTLIYTLSDGQGAQPVYTAQILVAAVNDAPEVEAMSASVDEDNALTFDALAYASDVDGDELSLTSLASEQGTVTQNGQGEIVFTPHQDFNGPASVTFNVTDGQGGTTPATLTLDVIAVNDAPELFPATASTFMGEAVQIDILSQVSDVDGDTLSISSVTAQNGTITGNSNGIVTFMPATDFEGLAAISACVTDSSEEVCGVWKVQVINPNSAPVLEDLTIEISEDQSTTLALHGFDEDGDALTYRLITEPEGKLAGNLPNVNYTPPQDFDGQDQFMYVANDGQFDSNIALVTIVIGGENDAPVALDDVASSLDYAPLQIDVLANDSDPDGDDIRIVGVTSSFGEATHNGDMLTYTPVEGFIGGTVIEYTIRDDAGHSASARVLVTIDPDGSELLPVITVPDDVYVDATALFTKVDLGVASAVDRFGNPLPVSLIDGVTFYKPGINIAYWLAEDEEGLQRIASQFVRVRPLVSIDKDQTVLEGRSVSLDVHLNGHSPVYPLTIPYTVSGTAGADDHNLVSGELVITAGTEGTIRFDSFTDDVNDGDETVVITLGDTLNLGNKFEHVITLAEGNVDPVVNLMPYQSGEQRVVVTRNGGAVTIRTAVTHPDTDNEYEYAWLSVGDVLTDADSQESTFTFDPSSLENGIYEIDLTITDTDDRAFGDTNAVYVQVVSSLESLGDEDSDGDGVPDSVEGYRDTDGDGIPDYLDAIAECNVLPEEIANINGYLVEGDPGVCLRIGNVAIAGQTGGAQVLEDDYADILHIEDDSDAQNIGGVFDFIAYGLPQKGQVLNVVLPQRRPVPANAVYRKFTEEAGWFTFVETGENRLWSTAGEPGFCPPPGGDVWTPGLTEGHWCVQLSLVDGGPYDADGMANATIVDPGGVGVLRSEDEALPEAQSRYYEILSDEMTMLEPLDNGSDAQALSLISVSANFGEVEIIDNQLQYTPPAGFIGEAIIFYGVSDSQGNTGTGEIDLQIVSNKPPVVVDENASVDAGSSIEVNVLANDFDPDEDQLEIIVAQAEAGTVFMLGNGVLEYIPASGFEGDDTVTYIVQDTDGAETTGTLTVTVHAVEVRIENRSGGASYWLLILCIAGVFLRFYPASSRANKRD